MQPGDYFAAVEDRQMREIGGEHGGLFKHDLTRERDMSDVTCEICGRVFKSQQAMKVHKGRVHGKKQKPKPEPVPEFDHCDHVEQCGITGITDCGAGACNLVPDYRMELLEALADLGQCALELAAPDTDCALVYDAMARIKAVARG